MAIDFFDREVTRLQDMFNEAFGNRIVTERKSQDAAFFQIANIGVLARKINKARDKKVVRPEIQQFIYRRDVVAAFLERAISDRLEERRNHGTVGKRSDDERRTAAR